jgi:hypothetical protein
MSNQTTHTNVYSYTAKALNNPAKDGKPTPTQNLVMHLLRTLAVAVVIFPIALGFSTLGERSQRMAQSVHAW